MLVRLKILKIKDKVNEALASRLCIAFIQCQTLSVTWRMISKRCLVLAKQGLISFLVSFLISPAFWIGVASFGDLRVPKLDLKISISKSTFSEKRRILVDS